jgi:competence ComEA-like helix-hairpin-helix protein
MFEITPQERLALLVLCLLLTSGGAARYLLARQGPATAVEFRDVAADTTIFGSDAPPTRRVSAAVVENRERARPLGEGERIDPNRATEVDLDRLPGVGPALAARIVAHRQSEGRFGSLQDLGEVQGIGDALLEKIGPLVTLPASGSAAGRSGAAAGRIDLNRASAEQLDDLPGIGPAIAARIVAYRNQHGSFRTWDDVEEVAGVGPALRKKLEDAARLGR